MEKHMQEKFCKNCQTLKPISEFTKSNKKVWTKGNIKRNYVPKDGYHAYCKECNAKLAKEFRARYKAETGNADYRGTGKIKKYPKEDRLLISNIRLRVSHAKQNNKRSGRPFDIDADYMYDLYKSQKGLCALTGWKMQIEGNTNLKMSIDKIIPDLGYIKGNVQWTLFCANRAKGDMLYSDLIAMCKMIVERATTIENTEKSGSE